MCRRALALRAVPVAAGVVGDEGVRLPIFINRVRRRKKLFPLGSRVTHQAADSRTWNLLPVALA